MHWYNRLSVSTSRQADAEHVSVQVSFDTSLKEPLCSSLVAGDGANVQHWLMVTKAPIKYTARDIIHSTLLLSCQQKWSPKCGCGNKIHCCWFVISLHCSFAMLPPIVQEVRRSVPIAIVLPNSRRIHTIQSETSQPPHHRYAKTTSFQLVT